MIIQLFAIILVANLFSPAAWGKTSQLEKKDKLLLSLDGNYKGGVELTTLSSKMVFGYDRSSENYDMKISSCKAYCAGLFGQTVMVEDPDTGVREEQTRVVYAVGNQNLKDGPLDGDKSTGTGYKPENRNLPKSGTYYMITPQYDGHICAFVIFNSGKPFYVCKGSTGECLPVGALTLKADGNEPTNVSLNDDFTVDDKFTGTVEFDVTGGETYYLFGTGTKLSFGGYTYTYVLDHEDEIITFADEQVKAICVANWDLGGDGELSKMEAAKVTDLGWGFLRKPITSFDELQYFVGLTSIRDHAFSECTGLTSITIPNSVTTIGTGAFDGCTGLTSITIPNSVTTIGSGAFNGCTGLTSITIPNSVTTIEPIAFSGCTGLTSITIPNSVKTLEGNPFSNCSGLVSLTVSPENTVYDSRGNCNAIIETASNTLISGCKNTIIPNSVTSIGDYAFNGCTGLTSITIPNSVTTIGSCAFSGCTGLTSITIPNSVTSIGGYAFSECTGLTSITIPNSVTTIGKYAFSECTGLTSITIPNSVTTIGEYAFFGCTGLTSITIPNSVTSIGSNPFAYCYGLDSLTVSSENIVYDSRNNCNAIIETASNTLISGCKNTIIPNSVTTIGPAAFEGCTGLKTINIPNSVTTIGLAAFYRCTSLKSISIPNHVTEIEASTFRGCTSLTSVIIPDNVTLIGSQAFRDCTSLKRVTIPEGVTTVHAYAFKDCTKLRYVSIPSSLTDFGEEIFYGCNELEDVVNYATTPQSIPSNTFTKYSNLHVLPGCGDAYRYSQDWYMFTIVEDAVDANGMICPDDNHPHMIDLGLPSGTKWACCNVGADKPEAYGDYYAWGETESKSVYHEINALFLDGIDSNYDGTYDGGRSVQKLIYNIAGTDYDVAHVKWGGNWVIPSSEQQSELFNSCTSRWMTRNGVNGCLLTATNGNSIFLPAAGYISDTYEHSGECGAYRLTQDSEDYYYISSITIKPDRFYRSSWISYIGLSVRPAYQITLTLSLYHDILQVGDKINVEITSGNGSYNVVSSDENVVTAVLTGKTVTITGKSVGTAVITVTDTSTGCLKEISITVGNDQGSTSICPDDNHPHMIDLGLPSGTKWACCNVGADKPEAYGGYYAWGETEEKPHYSRDTYTHYQKGYHTNIGTNITGTKYDVAHMKWGESWVMPSLEQIKELSDNCTSYWTKQNGVLGRIFTGINDNKIFLPAAGYHSYDKLLGSGYDGHYWSSSQIPIIPDSLDDFWAIFEITGSAYNLNFYSDISNWGNVVCHGGYSVRPVYSSVPLSLSLNSINIEMGKNGSVEICSGYGNYVIRSSDEGVATASLSGTTIYIMGKSVGNTIITVTDSSTGDRKEIAVSVVLNTCPDDNHPHVIDLGLPSGTKWACCNVGADCPEATGGYFAYGETEEKSYYSLDTYNYYHYGTYEYLGDIAGTEYDVAHVKWGEPWLMPSDEEFIELTHNCTSIWTSQNNVYGRLFIGANGCSVFFPATGDYNREYLFNSNLNASYRMTNPRATKYILHVCFKPDYDTRYDCAYRGICVRPIIYSSNGIDHPVQLAEKSDQNVYNIYGVKVADSIDRLNTLRPGIYIVNGKKMVIK